MFLVVGEDLILLHIDVKLVVVFYAGVGLANKIGRGLPTPRQSCVMRSFKKECLFVKVGHFQITRV